MASSYSTSLKIQLMGNGEDSGTWGSITNTNWNLIEQAVSGVQTIIMANANYTLSNLNGVSDEARNMVIVATGTNSGIYQIIIPLNQPKFYVVTNSTTGGYAITIGTSGGSVITIPTGTTVQVYTDGTNTFSAQTSSAGNFNINGNLTVAGTTTLTGATTLSSALTYGGVALSNSVTGTGSMVLSATPTFTGTPAAPTASAGTNTTQLATTAFVTTAVANAFPSGTRLVFAQAAAPTGWTQDTSDTANNRMMRVVSSTGGGTGGTASPILMDVVPTHTHGFSTGTESNGHYHYTSGTTDGENANHYHGVSGGTSTVDINHYHSGTTGYMNQNVTHNHNPGSGDRFLADNGPELLKGGPDLPFTRSATTSTVDLNHTHYFDTGYMSANNTHSHSFSVNSGYISNGHAHTYGANSGGESTTHYHSGSTDGGSSQTNWAPRYNNVIICQKN
jgi:hypothetical protein